MTFDAGAIEARLILNRNQFQADLAAARAEGDAFDGKTFEARADLNYDEVKATFAKIASEWQAVRKQLERSVTPNLDTGEMNAKIAATGAAFEALRSALQQDVKVKADANIASKLASAVAASGPVEQAVTLNPDQAYTALQDLQNRYLELKVLVEQGLSLELHADQFEVAITEAIDSVNRLRASVETPIELEVRNAKAIVAIAETSAAFNTLRATMSKNISLNGTSAAGVGAAALAGAALPPPGGGGPGGAGIAAAGAAAGGAAGNLAAFTNGMAGLNTQFRLFNGVLPGFLGMIGSIHLIAQSIIELTGTLLPATVAFAAFAAAAVPTVQDLSQQMQTLHTVTQAYGVSLYPLTGGFQAVAAAVQPEVYVLFGEALTVASAKTGVFQQVAVGAGQALDQLGARFTVAITQSSTFGRIAKSAASDLAGWGNLIGNIGGIVGNFFNVLPGYAGIILSALESVTHVIEVITGSGLGQWLLGVGLAAHGALVWVGLLGTGLAVLASRGLAAVATSALSVATKIEGLGAAGKAAAGGMLNFAVGAEKASMLPWGWIALAAAGLAVLAYHFSTTSDAAQQFNSSMESLVQNAPLVTLQTTLSTAISQTQTKISQSAQSSASALKLMQAAAAGAGGAFGTYNDKLTATAAASSEYQQGLTQLQQQQQLVAQRVGQLGTQYGGAANALALLNSAGITSAQITDTNASHWQQTLVIIEAYNRALLATTQSAGRYGAAQNALNFTAGDSSNALGQLDSSMQKVTQAEDQLFNTLLGGEQTFVKFQDAIQGTIGANGQLAGGLAQAAGVAGASLSGLNGQSRALADTFYSTALPAAQKQADALQMQAISTSDLTKVTATMAEQLLQYAGNNTAARTSVVDLINNALGPGTVSLQNLNQWVGTNQTSMSGYKKIIDATTVSASALSGVLQQDVVQMMGAATAAAYGGQQAFTAFAQSVASGTTNGQQFTQNGVNVIQTLITTTGNADAAHRMFDTFANSLGMSTTQADALWTSLTHQLLVDTASKAGETKSAFEKLASQLGTDKTDADNLWTSLHQVAAGSPYQASLVETGVGTFVINGQAAPTPSGGVSFAQAVTQKRAAGGLITAGTGPTADDVPVLASKNEYFVSADAVSHYGVGLFDALNAKKLASGGLAGGAGSAAALAGATTANWNHFVNSMTQAMEAAITAATKAAIANASAAGGIGIAGVANGSGYAALQSAAAKAGWTGAEWQALVNVENREAGFRLTARNPSSGAYGMAQFINGPSEYYQYGGNPNTPAGQAVAMVNYIRQRYGDPIAAWQHELAYGWYDQGGVLAPGYTLAYNGTGQNEVVLSGNSMQALSSLFAPTATSGNNASGGSGQFVGNYTGVVSPVGGGFGLTDADLGIAPSNSSSPSSGGTGGDTGGVSGSTDTGTGSSGSGTSSAPPRVSQTAAQKAVIAAVEKLMRSYIAHNQTGAASSAEGILNYLGVATYTHTLHEISLLDSLLKTYEAAKKTTAVKAVETLLRSYGVHSFNPSQGPVNAPRSTSVSTLEGLIRRDIGNNNLKLSGQDNSLLQHFGVSKYTKTLSEISQLDDLLSKFKHAKSAKDVQAVETLLRQYGVKKFDAGGEWPDMTLGVNTSGRSETVITGAGLDDLVTKLEELIKVNRQQLTVAHGTAQATASRLSQELLNTPLGGAGMARRYPNNR